MKNARQSIATGGFEEKNCRRTALYEEDKTKTMSHVDENDGENTRTTLRIAPSLIAFARIGSQLLLPIHTPLENARRTEIGI